MKTPSRFCLCPRHHAVAAALLAGICLIASSAAAQPTNSPAQAPDTDLQSKARTALHETETALDAAKTNQAVAPAVKAAPAPTPVTATAALPAPATTKTTAKVEEAPADAEGEDLVNWVELGVGGSIVNGDKAQYQRQSGLPANTAVGGIKSMHYEKNIGKKGLFTW